MPRFETVPKSNSSATTRKKDFNTWFRYTQGGQHYSTMIKSIGWGGYLDQGEGYRQISAFAGNTYHVSEIFCVDYSFNYSMFDFERHRARDISSHRQDKYHTRAVANWTPNDQHALSFGGEWTHHEFGLKSPGYPDAQWDMPQAQRFGYGTRMPRWSSNTYSLMGEYQWLVTHLWTLFVGGRFDSHTFTDPMFSPRLALIHRPTDPDTLKVILQRSVRASTAEEMKQAYDQTGQKSDFEEMNSLELRWERKQNQKLWFALTGFLNQHDVVAWSNSTSSVRPLGELQTWGVELEAVHKTEKSKVTFSNGYTKLINFKLDEAGLTSIITSEPYGYGKNLANWHNVVTKLTGHLQATPQLSLNSTLNVYWGIPGGQDYADYRRQIHANSSVEGFDKPFDPSVFLNLGCGYAFSDRVQFNANIHDALGWIDEDINKRNKIVSTSSHESAGYRLISPSISVALRCQF